MKAFGIMGIVLLHAIFIQEGDNSTLSTALRLVAIKTLLFLSGYVVYGKIKNPSWVLEKIMRRLPLILIFTCIYWVYASYVVGFDGGERIDVSLGTFLAFSLATGFMTLVIWYIWVLMLCYGLLWSFERYVAGRLKRIPYLLKLWTLALVLVFIPYDYFGVMLLQWYGLFMLLGYTIRYLVEKRNFGKYKVWAYSAFVFFPVTLFLVGRLIDNRDTYVNSGYIDIARAVIHNQWWMILVYVSVSLTGIALVYSVSRIIERLKMSAPFVVVGNAIIGILLFHKMFLELKLIDNYWLSSLLALAVSLGLYLMLSRVNVLNYLLFGGTTIPIKISNRLEGWYAKVQA
jgi:hypothetical protein